MRREIVVAVWSALAWLSAVAALTLEDQHRTALSLMAAVTFAALTAVAVAYKAFEGDRSEY